MNWGGRAVSPLIATIILITLTVVGGIVMYATFLSTTTVSYQNTKITVEYVGLYKSSGEPKLLFSLTIKNSGSKPLAELTVQLYNESVYTRVFSPPLDPGKTTKVVLSPATTPQLHPNYYIVGNIYPVIITAKTTDGSQFTHTITVKCAGFSGATEKVSGKVLFESGFEEPYSNEWDITEGDPTYLSRDTSVVYEGSFSSKSSGDGFYAAYVQKAVSLEEGKIYFLSGWYRCDELDFSAMGPPWDEYIDIIFALIGGAGSQFGPWEAWSGVSVALKGVAENTAHFCLEYRVGGNSYFIDTGVALTLNQWYNITLEVYTNPLEGYVKLYINNVLLAQKENLDTTSLTWIAVGSSTNIWTAGLTTRTSWADKVSLYSQS